MANEQKIWNRLINFGMSKAGAAGVLGNLYAESVLNPKNLQNSYEKSLGYTDDTYTSAVDSGVYTNFIKDSAGYGLAQWTYWVRKQNLLHFAKSKKVSIGDLYMQLDFLLNELEEDYPSLLTTLCTTNDVKTASDAVMLQFERPADTSESARNKRYEYSKKYYESLSSSQITFEPTIELVEEILAGMWGNGDERKKRLINAGYDYENVQRSVNEYLANRATVSANDKSSVHVTLKTDDGTYSGILAKN